VRKISSGITLEKAREMTEKGQEGISGMTEMFGLIFTHQN
jgi:hypothetical protein